MMNLEHSTSTNVVRDEDLLKRRIKYFIKSGRGGRQSETALINALSQHAHLYVFGGLIRDISLYTAHQFRSDIDLVFAGSKEHLQKVLYDYGLQKVIKNKFGGFRVKDFTVDIDIWSFEETWAFKHHFIIQKDIESLLNTTLMTWDSVLYDIQNNRLITKDSWLTDLHTGRLDLVLEQTPDVNGALIRILRTIYGKNVCIVGEKLCQFLISSLSKFSNQDLLRYELDRFGTSIITSTRLSKLREQLTNWSGIGDMRVNPYLNYKQLDLDLTSPMIKPD
ncbi:hypothetical protein J8O29_002402 [Salmonella enterica]|uniref:Poly A polymerase head domain-containing protein n=1 Tax=Salmonella enterica TaxID=28901 RepID=A0A5T3MF63_SALER|nr:MULTISPECIES: hypothetical protein [Salmonella]EBP4006833.1 hypothetical protein [Salmonella enterica subsp. enterica]EAA2244822.1 hypothetical protein [Salmonella enterica subsp. enterica serovar Singapore]EAA7317171.1 hypothetical protein [Salmonella enterica subsp. enterica serovar Singapore]EAM9375149.1 hypothetical protein [Salmonella enterica]EAN2991292.1 hypothetical protein [Salmonella enterica]